MAALQSPNTKASSSRKRQSSQSLDHNHSAPKQQKSEHPSFPPAIFWDQLSEIPLTKNALRELDRRAALERSDDLVHDQDTAESVTRKDNDRAKQPSSVELQLSTSSLNEIRRCAKYGGSNLSALSDHRAPLEVDKNKPVGRHGSTTGDSTTPDQTYCTEISETMGQYDCAFEQHLIDHHILPDEYEYPDGQSPPEPGNICIILEALKQPRASTSTLSNADFRQFRRTNRHAKLERDIASTIVPVIEGEIADRNCVSGGIPFTNLDTLTDGTLAAGNPSFFYGARREQLAQNVRKELDGLIVPSTQCDPPIIPNFFLQVKGSSGDSDVALRKACYNGTLGARAIHSLQSYGQPTLIYDNNAYTLTSTYHAGALKMFTVHPLPPGPQHPAGFVMTQVNSWSLTGNFETFLEAVTAYRNGLDWAKHQRDEAIKRANIIAAANAKGRKQ